MDAYADSISWLRYRTLLRECFDVHVTRTPTERWEQVRDHHLHVDDWSPDGAPDGTVILVHGGGGNGRVLAPLGQAAADLGWRALAPDLPGYGITRPAPGFAWDYGEWPATVAALAGACSGPVVLCGLSVGGMTALFAAQQARAVAGVFATTLIDMNDPETFVAAARWPWLGRLSLLGMRLAPALLDRLALPLSLAAPLRAMSGAREMQRYFAIDPLLGRLRVPARFFRTMHEFQAASLDLPCPLMLAHPGADAWTPTSLSLATFARIASPKRFIELTGGSHLPVERPAFDQLCGEFAAFLGTAAPQGVTAESLQ
jgi:pimeloyl-ACP methyl ester carboxylesterase